MLSAAARFNHDWLRVVRTQGQLTALEVAAASFAPQPVHEPPYPPVDVARGKPLLFLE